MPQTDRGVEFRQTDIEELPAYRPVSVLAVVGLLFGVAAGVALFHPVMWIVPLVALAVNVHALRTIDRTSSSIGRQAAVWGLGLAAFFLVCAPARVYLYEYLERREAREFASLWFDALRHGRPEVAYQMTKLPNERTLDESRLKLVYGGSETNREGLAAYVQVPLVRTLLALGDRALVRYYSTESAATDGRNDAVEDVYAVTYDDQGQQRTFFVKLGIWRNLQEESAPRGWRIRNADGGHRPKDWPAAG